MLMRKKYAVSLAAAVVAALGATVALALRPNGGAYADEEHSARVFDSSADFSVTENGYRNWYYMSGPTHTDRDPAKFKPCTEHFDANSWRGDGAFTVIFRDETVIHNHDNGPVRAFKAPYSGNITYTVKTKLGDGSPAVDIWIMHNGTELDAFAAQKTADMQTYNVKTYDITVAANDHIYFVTAPGEDNIGGNSLKGILRAVYTELTGDSLTTLNELIDKISALPDASAVTAEDYESLTAALAEINAVDPLLRSFVSAESENKLSAVRIAVYVRKAEAMMDAIPNDLTLDDERTVTSAREFYDALTDDEKSAVASEKYDKLVGAEKTVYGLYVASILDPLVEAIPETVALSDKAAVLAAKRKYEEFTEEQKKYISDNVLGKLNNAVEALIVLESEAHLVYNACVGFSTVQGKNGWRYGTVSDGGEYVEYAKPLGDRWDSGDYAIISERFIHPGSAHDPVKKFVAPYDGIVNLNGSLYKQSSAGDCIIDLGIYLNGKNLYEGVAVSVTPEQCTPQSAVKFAKTDVDVKAGDEIMFVYARRGDIAFGTTLVETDIVYTALYDAEFSGLVRKADDLFEDFPDTVCVGDGIALGRDVAVFPGDATENYSYTIVRYPNDTEKAIVRDADAFISEGKLYALTSGNYAVYAIGDITGGIAASKDFTVAENKTGKANNSFIDYRAPQVSPQLGNGNWYYMHGADGNFTECDRTAVFDGINYYQGSNTYTLIDGGAHIIGQPDDLPVTAWRAPVTGVTEFVISARIAENSPRLAYEIWHNKKKIKDATTVSAPKSVGAAIEISVKAGDSIYIVVKDAGEGIAGSKMILTANAAYKSIDMINVDALQAKADSLPSADEATAACKQALDEAVAAYDALSVTEKAFLSSSVTEKLAVLVENMPAYELSDGIAGLPSLDEIVLSDSGSVNALMSAYNALSAEQKVAVKNSATLVSANNKIVALGVAAMIDSLPEEITAEQEIDVETVKRAYDLLTEAQKAFVENYDRLAAATQKITEHKTDIAAARAVEVLIGDIPKTVVLGDKITVELAKHGYDALTAKQKTLVDCEKLDMLKKAVSAVAALELEYKSVTDVQDSIDALPAVGNLTLANKPAVGSAQAKYDALTEALKASVENAQKLAAASARIAALEKAKASARAAETLIAGLPDDITLADRTATENARRAYATLSADARTFVGNIWKLELAEATIARIDGEIAYVTGLINALDRHISSSDKDVVLNARAAYDMLGDDAKAEIKNIATLELAEKKLAQTENGGADNGGLGAVVITFIVLGCILALSGVVAAVIVLKKKKSKKVGIEQGAEKTDE